MMLHPAQLITRLIAVGAALHRSAVSVLTHLVAEFGRALLALILLAATGLALLLKLIPSTSQVAFRGGLMTIVAFPALLIGFLVVTAFTNPFVAVGIRYDHQRSAATELLDANGRWLGILPPANFADWSDGTVLPADHAAVPLMDIPPVWRACMVELEDHEFDGLSGVLGFNPIAFVSAGWDTIAGGRARGASTLYMQVIRMLDGREPGLKDGAAAVLLRKIAEFTGARALAALIASGEGAPAERFIGMHLPLVVGLRGMGFGGDIYGVVIAARILFDKAPAELSLEEQAVLAAAVKHPIVLAPLGEPSGRAASEKRWRAVVRRADYCLAQLDLETFSRPAIETARERLTAMPPPTVQIDDDLRALLPADPRKAWQIAANPVSRANYFAGHELRILVDELAARLSADWRGRAITVQLTTSAVESRRFVGTAAGLLANLERNMSGLAQRLTRSRNPSNDADIVIVCADPEGQLRRVYSSDTGLFWRWRTPVGSVAKLVAAVALAGRDGPNVGYCAAPIAGVPGGTGTDCADPTAWISAREAFAHSSNTAIHWALRHRVSTGTLDRVRAALELPSFGETPVATALTLGTFDLTPAEMLTLIRRIGGGIAGEAGSVPRPTVIRKLVLDGPGVAIPAPTSKQPATSIMSRRAWTRVFDLLDGTTRPGGTLHALSTVRDRVGGRMFAKTGTVSVGGRTLVTHIAGAILQGGHPWPFVVTVGSPSSRVPLGPRLTASRFAALGAAAICSPVDGSAYAARAHRGGP
jgi:hypothetical protein